jgi:protein-disulfide isomerase
MHLWAHKAAEAAECAAREGKFWDMHNWLFEHQRELDEIHIHDAATAILLDAGRFSSCLEDVADKVDQEIRAAAPLAIPGTPTFFVGRRLPNGGVRTTARMSGVPDLATLEKMLQQASASS